MTLALILAVSLLVIFGYAFWLAGELGVGPRLFRSRPKGVDQLKLEQESSSARKRASV